MRKWLIILMVVVTALITGYYFYLNSHFRLVKTVPKNKGQAAVTSEVAFYFNRDMADVKAPRGDETGETQNAIEIVPSVSGKTIAVGKKISFLPNAPLDQQVTYRATLRSVKAQNGDRLGDIEISFQTIYTPFNKLPKSAQDNLTQKTDGQETRLSSKEKAFINRLPYYDTGFSIEYLPSKNTYVVTVSKAPVDQYKQAAQAYLQSQGVNLAQTGVSYTTIGEL